MKNYELRISTQNTQMQYNTLNNNQKINALAIASQLPMHSHILFHQRIKKAFKSPP